MFLQEKNIVPRERNWPQGFGDPKKVSFCENFEKKYDFVYIMMNQILKP